MSDSKFYILPKLMIAVVAWLVMIECFNWVDLQHAKRNCKKHFETETLRIENGVAYCATSDSELQALSNKMKRGSDNG